MMNSRYYGTYGKNDFSVYLERNEGEKVSFIHDVPLFNNDLGGKIF